MTEVAEVLVLEDADGFSSGSAVVKFGMLLLASLEFWWFFASLT